MKHLLKNTALLLLCSTLAFCSKKDDDTPEQEEVRKEKNLSLQNELTAAQNGWKINYTADDNSHGSYQFLMKFTPDGQVSMLSDLEDTATSTTSRYNTREEAQGLILSFLGQNKIHLLADAVQGKAGNDLRGKIYQFLYTGKEGQKLTFKNLLKSSQPTLVFEPASETDWRTLPTLSLNLKAIEANSSSYYLTINSSATSTTYPIGFNNRVLTVSGTTTETPVYATEKGIGLKNGLSIGGVNFTELERKAGSNPSSYQATVNGVTALLHFSSVSPDLFNTNDYKDIDTTIEGFAIMSSAFKNHKLMSADFYKDVLRINNTSDLFLIRVMFEGPEDCYIQVGHIFEGEYSIVQIVCKYELKNKRLYLKDSDRNLLTSNPKVWDAEKNKAVAEQASRAIGAIYDLGAEGFYIKKLDIKVAPQEDNPVYLLQSHEFPLYVFPCWGVPK